MRAGETQQIRFRGWPLLAAAAGLSVVVLNPAFARDIYRWVGEDGSVHYSDSPPPDEVPVTVLEVETSRPADYDPADDPYSILNQASRIHGIWLDFEAARQARAQERLETVVYSPRRYPPTDEGYFEYSAYPYYSVSAAPVLGYRPGYRREQLRALHALDLLGPRPQSINSGAHQNRVARSHILPIVPTLPRPQPR